MNNIWKRKVFSILINFLKIPESEYDNFDPYYYIYGNWQIKNFKLYYLGPEIWGIEDKIYLVNNLLYDVRELIRNQQLRENELC